VNELEKEGLAQLQALGFCVRCCQPFVREYIKVRIPGSKLEGWEKVCPGCMISLIVNPDEKE
jgi:hypothetical protein